jgi:hypothetical protein
LDSGDNKFDLLYNFVVALHCDFDFSKCWGIGNGEAGSFVGDLFALS